MGKYHPSEFLLVVETVFESFNPHIDVLENLNVADAHLIYFRLLGLLPENFLFPVTFDLFHLLFVKLCKFASIQGCRNLRVLSHTFVFLFNLFIPIECLCKCFFRTIVCHFILGWTDRLFIFFLEGIRWNLKLLLCSFLEISRCNICTLSQLIKRVLETFLLDFFDGEGH